MSIEKDVETIGRICEAMETRLNTEMADIIEKHDRGIAANVLINIGTTMLAKAIVLVKPEHKDVVIAAISSGISTKAREGEAAVQSLIAISKAMESTCRPLPPKR